MKYENPQIPEGINVSKTHPLKELAILAGSALLLLAAFSFLLGHSAAYLARMIPFETEVELSKGLEFSNDGTPGVRAYLDGLTQRIGQTMDLPQGMKIQIHYYDDDTVNAFATVGGHLLLYRGLLEKVTSENTLAMLIAHEVAHVKHRDPVSSLGSGISIQLLIGVVLGNSGATILSEAGALTLLHFSRSMEREADADALSTLKSLYGHVNGATDLFATLKAEHDKNPTLDPPAFFLSHPQDQQRIQAIRETAARNSWDLQGELTPLPAEFQHWLAESSG